jgi:hypothetical protein
MRSATQSAFRSGPLALAILATVALGLLTAVGDAHAQNGLALESDTLTKTVLVHPVIDTDADGMDLMSTEHEYKPALGQWDQLARDFLVTRVGDDGIPRLFRRGSEGTSNEDWFGWRRDVLAPFDGTVTRVVQPDRPNAPGEKHKDRQPGGIFFESGEVAVLYGHVREIEVEEGQRVEAGEVVAKVGNNANSSAPHVHVGAWKNGTPLQVQVVLHAGEQVGAGATSGE